MSSKIYFHILTFFALSSLLACSDGQVSLDQSDVFIKYYGSSNDEQAIDLIALSDGYLILGSHTEGLNTSFYLIRTDLEGNTIWDRLYSKEITDGNGDFVNVASKPSAMRLYNGESNLIMVGTSSYNNIDHLYMVDVTLDLGDTIRTKTHRHYFDFDGEYKDTFGADILPFQNGSVDGYLVLGTTDVPSQVDTDDDTSVLLMLWTKDFYGADSVVYSRIKGFSGDDFGYRLIEKNNKYFYLASLTDAVSKVDIQIAEFDPTFGGIETPVVYSTPADDIPTNIEATDLGGGGDMTVTGYTGIGADQYAIVFRVSSGNLVGKTIQTVSFNKNDGTGEVWNGQGYDLVQRADGQIYVIGEVSSYKTAAGVLKKNDIVLMPTGGTNSVPVDGALPYGSEGDDRAVAAVTLADGSIVIAATVDFDGDVNMISLLKTNSKGEFRP